MATKKAQEFLERKKEDAKKKCSCKHIRK